MSALQLQRQLGIESYETAWALLHKLRRSMVRPGRELLRGEVEVDEAYIGGSEKNLEGGRQLVGKALVVGAVELRGKGSGRVRLQVVPHASADSLVSFVAANVEKGSTVRTDGWKGYLPLGGVGYRHRAKTRGTPERAKKLLPRVPRVFGNLQTWLRGTHPGVANHHLQAYLDEFTFRLNRRRTPMAAFQTLLGLASSHLPATYKILYGSESTR